MCRAALAATAWAAAVACGGASEPEPEFARLEPRSDGAVGLRTLGLRGLEEAPGAGARLVPERLDSVPALGTEPGGGDRKLVAGVRLVARSDGGVLVGAGRLPSGPSSEIDVPERLGGGVLFATGSKLWRAASWLGAVRLVAVAPDAIDQIFIGLDRVYLRFGRGTLGAIDPRDGTQLGLGPLPAAPWLSMVVSQDAWRASVTADLRGTLVTEDAGATWRRALATGESETHAPAPRASASSRAEASEDRRPSSGPTNLALAVSDGWPLADGTAVVARDGALTRVSLADGSILETIANAFPLNPSRCRPFSLATIRDSGAFGYVCGEPGGQTGVFAWEVDRSRLVELRRFAGPRQVNGFGNGALAALGPCGDGAPVGVEGSATAWCVMSPRGEWTERRVRQAGARLVALADGRVVLLTPPPDGDLTRARISLLEGAKEISTPISFPSLSRDLTRTLRFGVWMDGFEERRPGWLGGWVDLAGTVVGIEISVGGLARVGEYVSDAGSPTVAGRWGFGWPRSRQGFETTDGGMTWSKGIVLPDPLAEPAAGQEHACGPIGCVMDGWVRVGWGADAQPASEEPIRLPRRRALSASPLRLACEQQAKSGSDDARRAGYGLPAEIVTRFPPLWNREGPAIPKDQIGLWADPSSPVDGAARSINLARAYAWGPHDDDWDGAGQWALLWVWPWGADAQVRASEPSPAPWSKLEAAQAAMRSLGSWQNGWTVITGDDADHALLVARASSGSSRVALLESGRGPLWLEQPFDTVEAATRLGGNWYLATAGGRHEPAATVVWRVDGAVTRELVTLPRPAFDAHARLYLGRRSDGRALGIAVEGQPDIGADSGVWVVAVDPDTGDASDPEPLASMDAREGSLPFCDGDEPGWVLDMPYPASTDVRIGAHWAATLSGATARLRLSTGHTCVESVAGSTDREASTAPRELSHEFPILGLRARDRTIDATVYCARQYFKLRCVSE
jgi:hypothetical protein